MSSIAQRQPRTGRRKSNLRAYLAGTAATAALIGAVVIAFASLGAYVAFNGLPVGGSEADVEASSVAVDTPASPPRASGQRTSQNTAGAEIRRSQTGGAANGGSAASASQASGSVDPVATPTPAGTGPTVGAGGSAGTASPTSAQTGPSQNPPASQSPSSQVTAPGAVGGTVGAVEQTLQEAGVEVPINGSGSAVDAVSGGLAGGN